jgi:hypothetical protein
MVMIVSGQMLLAWLGAARRAGGKPAAYQRAVSSAIAEGNT